MLRSIMLMLVLSCAACREDPAPVAAPIPTLIRTPAAAVDWPQSGMRFTVSSIVLSSGETPGTPTIRVQGQLHEAATPPGPWEAVADVRCEHVDRSDGVPGYGFTALVPLEGPEQRFSITREWRGQRFRWCTVGFLLRPTCSSDDLRGNECDESEAIELPSVCLTPRSGADRWVREHLTECREWWQRASVPG